MTTTFFLRLVLAHMLGDYVFQPVRLVVMKRRGWTGLITHSIIHTVITGMLLWGQTGLWWFWTLALGIIHLAIDQYRTFFAAPDSRYGLYLFLADQVIHLAVIVATTALGVGWQSEQLLSLFNGQAALADRVMAYLIIFIALVWTAPVLEFEAVRTLTFAYLNPQMRQDPRVDLADRFLGAVERLIATVLVLLRLWVLVPVAFIPRLVVQWDRWRRPETRLGALIRLLISFVLAVCLGGLLSLVPLKLY